MSNRKRISSSLLSPLQIESDQKDIIISQLRQQIYRLKKNQAEFYQLQDQYKKLEYRYKMLVQQKNISDHDFRDRHDMALRNICQLKNQLDALRTELRERGLELDDLQTDQGTLRNQIDQSLIEIDKLKSQMNSLYVDGEELNGERSRLQGAIRSFRGDIQMLQGSLKNLGMQNESVRKKLNDIQKYIDQLRIEQNLLKEKIISYENQNNGLDNDINQTIEDISKIDNQNQQTQADIKKMQTELAQLSGISDKFKSQAMHYHKAQQTELMKNNDFCKSLMHAENTLKLRSNQVQQGKFEVQQLRQQNNKVNEINVRLSDDIQFCQKHLQNLSLLNANLVLNLEAFSEQDESVRHLIDRKHRVQKAKVKVDEISLLMTRMTQNQPMRISKFNY